MPTPATVDITLPHHRYEVRVGPGLLRELGSWAKQTAPNPRAAVFADAAVLDTHGATAKTSLEQAGFKTITYAIPSGEQHKNLDTARGLYDRLTEAGMERGSPVIAVGGGVTGDTVGFVASTYLRGVPFIQCPTTLLAMVDASVGGKVGVNLPQGKNLVGSFYHPRLVIADTDTLATLPLRELRCGLAECVKHAAIRDENLFAWLEHNLDKVLARDPVTLVELVQRNVRIKADVVMADEKEADERAHLNFGHTSAHAIEATTGYGTRDGYHHGEAVSLGMVAATWLAVHLRHCDQQVLDRLVKLLNQIGLPTRAKNLPRTPDLIRAMQADKKVADGKTRLVLPERIGGVKIVNDAPAESIAQAWEAVRQPS